jgi:16S rRNA processing protein RimM
VPGAPSSSTDLLAVGVVTSTYGVGGELKVKSFSGETGHLVALREVVFRKRGVGRLLRIESVRPRPLGAIVKIAGIDAPETARALVGWEMWVPRSKAAKLSDGEYYMADLCRCAVWFGEERIGNVRAVLDAGASQMLEIENGGGRVFLVPFTDHFIGEVNPEQGRIFLKEDEIAR